MFKTLTKTLAITGVILGGVSVPAKASQPHQDILNTLEQIGVPVLDGKDFDKCQPKNGAYALGYYHTGHNVIVLCTNNGTEDKLLVTLAHEALHTVQDCVAGGLESPEIKPIGDWTKLVDALDKRHIRIITELYPKNQWGLEVEARTFETQPQLVNQALKRYCF